MSTFNEDNFIFFWNKLKQIIFDTVCNIEVNGVPQENNGGTVNITLPEMADGSITADKLADGSVSFLKLAEDAAKHFAQADHNHNNTYYTKSEVDNLVESGGSGGDVTVPTKVSELENDLNFQTLENIKKITHDECQGYVYLHKNIDEDYFYGSTFPDIRFGYGFEDDEIYYIISAQNENSAFQYKFLNGEILVRSGNVTIDGIEGWDKWKSLNSVDGGNTGGGSDSALIARVVQNEIDIAVLTERIETLENGTAIREGYAKEGLVLQLDSKLSKIEDNKWYNAAGDDYYTLNNVTVGDKFLSFDGSSSYAQSNDTVDMGSNPRTIEIVFAGMTKNASRNSYCFGMGVDDKSNFLIGLNSSNNIIIYTQESTNTITYDVSIAKSIAVTIDDMGFSVYINGSFTKSFTTKINTSEGKLVICNTSNISTASRHMKADIYAVRLYSSALTSKQLWENYKTDKDRFEF